MDEAGEVTEGDLNVRQQSGERSVRRRCADLASGGHTDQPRVLYVDLLGFKNASRGNDASPTSQATAPAFIYAVATRVAARRGSGSVWRMRRSSTSSIWIGASRFPGRRPMTPGPWKCMSRTPTATCCGLDRSQSETHPLVLVVLEILHGTLVRFCLFARSEGAQVAPPSRPRFLLA